MQCNISVQVGNIGRTEDFALSRAFQLKVSVHVSGVKADLRIFSFQDLLRGCLDQIEQMISEFTDEHASSLAARDAHGATSMLDGTSCIKAATPTDVSQVHF